MRDKGACDGQVTKSCCNLRWNLNSSPNLVNNGLENGGACHDPIFQVIMADAMTYQ